MPAALVSSGLGTMALRPVAASPAMLRASGAVGTTSE